MRGVTWGHRQRGRQARGRTANVGHRVVLALLADGPIGVVEPGVEGLVEPLPEHDVEHLRAGKGASGRRRAAPREAATAAAEAKGRDKDAM